MPKIQPQSPVASYLSKMENHPCGQERMKIQASIVTALAVSIASNTELCGTVTYLEPLKSNPRSVTGCSKSRSERSAGVRVLGLPAVAAGRLTSIESVEPAGA